MARRSSLTTLALAAFLWGFGLCAQEPLWIQSFESRVPGEMPDGWRILWGQVPSCDSIAVSNMESLGGRKSLLLERRASDGELPQYGLSCVSSPVPKAAETALVVPFMLSGAGNVSSFGLEIRESNGREKLFCVSAGNGSVFARGEENRELRLGPVRQGSWQRVRASFPKDFGAKGSSFSAVLETRQPDGSWLSEGKGGVQLKLMRALNSDRRLCLMLCLGISRGPYSLYLDELSLETASPLE